MSICGQRVKIILEPARSKEILCSPDTPGAIAKLTPDGPKYIRIEHSEEKVVLGVVVAFLTSSAVTHSGIIETDDTIVVQCDDGMFRFVPPRHVRILSEN